VVEFVPAGTVPARTVGPGQAAKIMTGAPVPEGADAVVRVERTEALEGARVRIRGGTVAGRNVAPRGAEVREGAVVLPAGRRIRAEELAVLAAVGCVRVPVRLPPRVAVVTTGDEIVPPDETPGPGRIRNSNSVSLAARIRRDGGAAEDHGIVPDDLVAIRSLLGEVLGRHEVVVLTGGVSMGDRDLVGAALLAEGFETVFHRIRLKPGKPLLFGVAGGSLVFGLPGNPVSAATTYELLVRPAIRTLIGDPAPHRPRLRAVLADDPPRPLPREQYLPAVLRFGPDGFVVRRTGFTGSADLFGAADSNAFLVVPAGGPAPERGAGAEVVALLGDLPELIAEVPGA
jgi:molybdopterin molybdotransferase